MDTLYHLLRDLGRLDKVGVQPVRQLVYLVVSIGLFASMGDATDSGGDLVESNGLLAPVALEDPHDHVGECVLR